MTRWLNSWTKSRPPGGRESSERGAVLLLAMLFVVAVGLVATALAAWATNDLNNAKIFTNVEALHSDATGMMKLSVQYVRYNPVISASQAANVASPAVACWGGSDPTKLPIIDGDQVAVWCSTVWNPGLASTRVVTFYACAEAVPVSVCTSSGKTLLTEIVTFDDYPTGINAPNQTLCSTYCGEGMTVSSSKWGSSVVDTLANAPSTAAFIVEPSSTIVNAGTTAQVEILDSEGLPLSGETVTLTVQAPGSLSSTSTLISPTNVAGVADFSNIVPTSAGTLILQAMDGAASTTSTGFNVAKGANSITILAANPGDTQVGSVVTLSPSPAASATSGQVVGVSGTVGVCDVAGDNVTVTTIHWGTCVLTLTDNGNANFAAATPVTMSFNVTPLPAYSLSISAVSSSPLASSQTNDTLTLTLLDKNGNPAVSNQTTTVTLSASPNGYFASAPNTGADETSVQFANGVGTMSVYFGDAVASPPLTPTTVTASSTGLVSASISLQIMAAPVSQLVISATSTTPADQYGNDPVTLTLENAANVAVIATSPTTVNLTSTSGAPPVPDGSFFTQSETNSTPITSVVIPAGSSSTVVYFGTRLASSSPVTLSANSSGLSSVSTTVIVTPGPFDHVVMVPNSLTVPSGNRTNTSITIDPVDVYGNVISSLSGPSTTYSISDDSTGCSYRFSTITTCGYFSPSNNVKQSNSYPFKNPPGSLLSFNLSNGPVTVYFGDTTAGDNPHIFVKDVATGTVAAEISNVQVN